MQHGTAFVYERKYKVRESQEKVCAQLTKSTTLGIIVTVSKEIAAEGILVSSFSIFDAAQENSPEQFIDPAELRIHSPLN